MSAYNPYANIGHQANGAPQQPFQTQPRPPVAPGPQGYQQGTPYGQDAPGPQTPQQPPYSGTPQPGQQSYGNSQSPGYFPPQGHAATENAGTMGGLTSQMGGMGLSQDGIPGRTNKKKNRHAYHNLDQSTVASQAFNQSVGNAPQYVNQDDAQPSGNPYGGQAITPAMNQFPAQPPGAPPFTPGLQQAPSPAMRNMSQPQQAPASVDTGVSSQGRVDPEQIPSVARARDGAAYYYLNHIYPTMEQHLPPPNAVPFVAQDQGNSSPKFARLTLNNIPASSDALSQTGLPLGLVLQPLASLQAGEREIPVLDFGDVGPPRCRRCRAYINPFMVFRSGGNKLVCNMCTFPNDVTPDYFAPTDPSGIRVDRAQRPELTTGTVEYLVPREYWAKEPVGLRWLFVIGVSQDAVEKGFLAAFCDGVLNALYGDDVGAETSEEPEGEDEEGSRPLPRGSKVGFVTYDKVVHFYNCNERLEKAQMLVMPDIEEAFVPLGSDGLFVDPYKSKPIITSLIRSLPSLFFRQKNPESTLLPALDAAVSSLAATGGKIICSAATLPTLGPGRLFLRDKNDLHGIETEKKLFQTEHPGWRKLAGRMVENGVGTDFFIAAAGGKYMDLATIGHTSAVSGGETYFYPNFFANRDALQLSQELRHTVTRETGYQALMKVRCSNGLQVSGYHGNFLQHNFGADLEFGVIDADKSVGVMFSYDGKLDPRLDAHFQCALLYTTSSGERRVRCTNTVASVSEGAAESMRFIDQDAVVNMIAKEAATRMTEKPLKEIRNALTEKTVDILAGYRKSFSTSHPPGQLVLPENLKEFSMYMLGLMKSRAFKAGHEPSDRRTHTMRMLKSMSSTTLPLFLYPRILPLHSLPAESGFADAETGHLVVPASIRASFSRIEEGGAYLVDDGQTCLLWLHSHVSPNLLEDLFGPEVNSLQGLDPATSTLPILETHLNAQVRNILAYWASFRGSKSGLTTPIQVARQGLDGSEFEFARMLVEDRNNEAQSYVDWLVNVHRHIQMELAGQRKREDGGGGGLGMESAMAGITSLWSTPPSGPLKSQSPARQKESRSPPTRSSKRSSNIPQQLFQFALGYPQTPPENSPTKEKGSSGLEDGSNAERRSMGSFVFRWDHPANDVHVTGTFDDWSKSVQLVKKGPSWEKEVDLPSADRKIYYKFVVDNNWVTDHTAPQETDEHSNVNNVLLPENIKKHSKMDGAAASTISGVTPNSTTAQLAKDVPKESGHNRNESAVSDVPGGYPETPFHDAQEFNVNPIPATAGHGNPISLRPGEKVPPPSTITTNDTTTADSLDKESYDKVGTNQPPKASGAAAGTGDTSTAGMGAGLFGVAPVGKGVIPESSIPMGSDMGSEKDLGPTIQSSGAGSTTAALAANVPKEPRGVPTVVSESQQEAGVGPEASSNPAAVKEKSAMEKELENKVPEEQASSDGALGGASGKVPPSVQKSIDEYNSSAPIASTVPDPVQESIAEAKVAPEAAGSTAMVGEKAAVEDQLKQEIKPTNATGEPAPTNTAATTDKAPAATTTATTTTTGAAAAGAGAGAGELKPEVPSKDPESRDVSPMSKPTTQSQPTVTTGVGSSNAPATSTPTKSTAAATPASPASKSSAGASTDKKSKRSSGIFSKIKEKFKHDKS